jgi:hypothetical protein
MMKKLLILAITLILCLAACGENGGGGGNGSNNIEGSLEELMQKLYGNLDSSVDLPPTMEEKLTPQGTQFNENVAYFIGADDIPFTEGLVSEHAMGMAYSLVLLRMEPGADVEAAKTKMREGLDPWKWVCAGVDPSDVIVDSIGDLTVIIMSDDSKALHDAFLALES